LRRRLAELGLTPGVQMTVLQNTGGPVLVSVRNSRLALGRQMAHHLDVLPLQAEEL
jgi:Fe2+ transport system protein FeoA